MKEKSFWFWFGIILAISLVVVPALLNWILQWHVPVCIGIIGEEDAPRVWLAFWGAFLAAIGSLVMAIIAFFTAREDRRQDVRRYELDMLREDYRIFERDVQYNEAVHSFNYFVKLIRDAEKGSLSSDSEMELLSDALREHYIALTKSSSLSIKFDKADETDQRYMTSLGEINKFCLWVNECVKELIEDNKPIRLISKYLNENGKKWNELYGKLLGSGFDFLAHRHSIIKSKYKMLNNGDL